MKTLLHYIASRISLNESEINLAHKFFTSLEINAQTVFLESGKTEKYVYFLSNGIVKGYQNINGKIIIKHLVDKRNFFSSFDSFTNGEPSLDSFETITNCKLVRISKPNLDFLRSNSSTWNAIIETIINEHLSCKMERVSDFQVLSAKERYLKFMNQTPQLALSVSIENIASFLGMEPQSLSRIRKQITF